MLSRSSWPIARKTLATTAPGGLLSGALAGRRRLSRVRRGHLRLVELLRLVGVRGARADLVLEVTQSAAELLAEHRDPLRPEDQEHDDEDDDGVGGWVLD